MLKNMWDHFLYGILNFVFFVVVDAKLVTSCYVLSVKRQIKYVHGCT